MSPIRLALIGLGKIARDQHLPAISANPEFVLVAGVSQHDEGTGGVPQFPTIDALAASGIAVDAVSICTPPQVRRGLALAAMGRGWHVFLEKPPASTLAEVEMMRAAAVEHNVSLFASWHSRYAAGIEPARAWLAERAVRQVTIAWREDVRVWHPGQDWIWAPGGFGVFDPGINALSIITHLLPQPIFIDAADLYVPANHAAPIAARLNLRDAHGLRIDADFDFRQQGIQTWEIAVETDAGTLALIDGGARLMLPDGKPASLSDDRHGEYAALYDRFADVVVSGTSEVDIAPLRLVGDAFLRGRHIVVEPFQP